MNYLRFKKLKKFIFWLIVCLTVAFAAVISYFFYFQPILKTYISQKASKYHIKLQPNKIGITGTINIANQHLSVDKIGSIFIQLAKIRPPLPFLPGFAIAKNIKVTNNNFTIIMPVVNIDDITKNQKINSTNNKLRKYNIHNIYIPKATIIYKDKNHLQHNIDIAKINITNIKNGNIQSITFDKLNLQLPYDKKLNKLLPFLTSNANITTTMFNSELKNINLPNIAHIWNGDTNNINKQLWDNIQTSKLNFKICENENCAVIFRAQNVNIGAFIVKPFTIGLNNILKEINPDNYEDILNIVKHVKKIGVSLDNIFIHTPQNDLNLDKLELKPDNWEKLIPYNLLFNFTNLNISKDKNILDPNNDLKLSGKIKFTYNPAKQNFALDNLDINMNNTSKFRFSFDSFNVDPKLFNLDEQIITNLKDSIVMHKLAMAYIDGGFIQSIINWISLKNNLNKEDVQTLIYALLEKSPPLLLHNKILGEIIGTKLLDIAQKPQSFSLTATSKSNDGLKLNEFFNNNTATVNSISQKMDLHIDNKYL